MAFTCKQIIQLDTAKPARLPASSALRAGKSGVLEENSRKVHWPAPTAAECWCQTSSQKFMVQLAVG